MQMKEAFGYPEVVAAVKAIQELHGAELITTEEARAELNRLLPDLIIPPSEV